MLIRFKMYETLKNYVGILETAQQQAVTHNSYNPLFTLLRAYRASFVTFASSFKTMHVDLHNVKCNQFFVSAFEEASKTLQKLEPNITSVMTTNRLVIGAFSKYILKIETLSTIQIKYFDSLMGIARKNGSVDRLRNIDEQLREAE